MKNFSMRNALDALLNQQQRPIEEVLDCHFSADYRQRTNGHTDDRAAFMRHAMKLREIVASARIEILDELQDGNRYADRHRVHVIKRDGSEATLEVHLFARLDAEGRFAEVDETTLLLGGSESDHGLGRAR